MNFIMYGVVPPRFFNLYADMAGILFAAAMSYIANNNNDTPLQSNDVPAHLNMEQ